MAFHEAAYSHPSLKFGPEDVLAPHMGDLIGNLVAEFGDKKALSCVLPTGHVAEMSFNELGVNADAVAAYLREVIGMETGDVVAIQCPNTLSYPVVAFGILRAGLKISNVNPLYTIDEAQHQLNDSAAKALFVIDVFGDRLAQSLEGTKVQHVFSMSLVDFFPTVTASFVGFMMKHVKKAVPKMTVPVTANIKQMIALGQKAVKAGAGIGEYTKDVTSDDVAFYQYTGGTTGRSKGAELTHANIVGNISQAKVLNGERMREKDHTLLLILPLYHVFALAVGCINSMANGVHVVLVPVPRPLGNIRYAFEKFEITLMPGVNTLFQGLLKEQWFQVTPPTTIEYCMSGAAPLHSATAKEWQDRTGSTIYEGYGLTESTCMVTSMPIDEPVRAGSCGVPIPGTEVRIIGDGGKDMPFGEKGELWIRGPQIMRGYLNRPEASAETINEDGWLQTGDVALVDEDGYIFIVDRLKDMVIVSGFNVYPADIEDVLTKSPRIDEAAVVGVKDAATGEKVVAYIVTSDATLTPDDVKVHCKDRLTGYKVPKIIEIIDELPKSPVGKVLRKDLREVAKAKYEK